MMQSVQDNHAFEMSLRDQLIAAQNGQPPPASQQSAQPSDQYHAAPQQPGSHDHAHNVDPAISGGGGGGGGGGGLGGQHISPYAAMPPPDSVSDDQDPSAGSKKAAKSRELSNTKRAAQNRAAQRAFRQRKEQYILKLEDDLKNYRGLELEVSALEDDNTDLRAYVANLQALLSEAKIEFPPVPPTARVARPGRVAYHQDDVSADTAHLHAVYASQPTSSTQPYYLEENRQYQDSPHYEHAPQPTGHRSRETSPDASPTLPLSLPMTADDERDNDDAIPPGAVHQLRAAAAQAGNLHTSRLQGQPDDYDAPTTDKPPRKRQRTADDVRPSTGQGGFIEAMISKLQSFAGAKA